MVYQYSRSVPMHLLQTRILLQDLRIYLFYVNLHYVWPTHEWCYTYIHVYEH